MQEQILWPIWLEVEDARVHRKYTNKKSPQKGRGYGQVIY